MRSRGDFAREAEGGRERAAPWQNQCLFYLAANPGAICPRSLSILRLVDGRALVGRMR